MMKISASLMCADQLEIIRSVISLIKLDIDYLHFDIMDGNFVNNLALNLNLIRQTRRLTRLPFDVHLMVQKPSIYFDELVNNGVDIIIFHLETSENIKRNIDNLKSKNAKVGLALHLETNAKDVEPYLPYIDYVLIMSVRTGFSGLKFDERVLRKINQIYSTIKKNNYHVAIIVDGGIKLEHVPKLYENGADIVVAGTSLLFNDRGFSNNLESFKKVTANLTQREA